MYDARLGVQQNYKEALKWYKKVAEQGNDSTQMKLGLMYEKGEGVIWYRKAGNRGTD